MTLTLSGLDFGTATCILVAEVFGGGGGGFFDLAAGSLNGSEEVRKRELGRCRDD